MLERMLEINSQNGSRVSDKFYKAVKFSRTKWVCSELKYYLTSYLLFLLLLFYNIKFNAAVILI